MSIRGNTDCMESIRNDQSICSFEPSKATEHTNPFLYMISIPYEFTEAARNMMMQPDIEPNASNASKNHTPIPGIHEPSVDTGSHDTFDNSDDPDIILEGACILFVMKRILFARRPRNNFKHTLSSAFSTYQNQFLTDDTDFNIDIHEQCQSKIPFGFLSGFMNQNNLTMEPVTGNLRKTIDMIQERKKTGNYIVFCSLNSGYTHPSNKKLERNPYVKNHCVLFRNGYILCDYLCALKDAKLSIIKHIKITSGDMNTENTSQTSYISRIKSIYKVV